MEATTMLLGAALLLGGLLILAGLAVALLVVVGVALAIIFLKTRQIIIPTITSFILNLVEAPTTYLLRLFGVEEDVVGKMVIAVHNILYKERFEKTPYNDRAMFLPQCLRSPNCQAPLTPEGIKCLNCGRCGIGAVKEEAESLGYKFFIAPGGSLIKRMVKKYKPKAIIGVGCNMEVKEGVDKMNSYRLPAQGVVLERDGCVDTRVDVIKLMDRIKARPHYSIEKDVESLKKVVEITNMWNNGKPSEFVVVEAKKTSEHGKW
ncbi:MAG: DUF116 domain-containing protein [Candidatus Altiarchaeota archaeon]